eukprot:CAMPEP_0119008600 /NCGR_PEP_ID=MMETSP1176-20130426/3815_1 /TAXON_ID=265551 /ORGANISM="Synedropsis recta cf, Strain CCMP1620" /LENGTH=336 /DNA_ID=CAMNT_0006960963 /DNA_START=13 /DNA_END=1023 /DNA_ORIENTATION=-
MSPPMTLLGVLVVLVSCLTKPTSAFLNQMAPTPVGRLAQQPLQASSSSSIIMDQKLHFRPATPEDMDACFAIESASYPADEAASREGLEFRQASATPYFRVVTTTDDDDDETIIGFCCSTRCHAFTEESMSTTHAPDGKLLAIHSVVVAEPYRRRGIATAMLEEYMESICSSTDAAGAADGLESIVLLAKSKLLSFYVNCGFAVIRPSPIVHGSELWYELEKRLSFTTLAQTVPNEDEQWFVKTETFCKPFPQVKPHLEAHKQWVSDLRRQQGRCITSGYRVDAEGKPGGGGLLFLAAKNYDEALELVLQDPLVANECVEWQLNGWIGQVGDVQLR